MPEAYHGTDAADEWGLHPFPSGLTGGCIPTVVGLDDLDPAANVNNQSLPAGGVGFRFVATSNRDITGMVAGDAGDCVQFYNGGANTLKFKNESGSSTAANRFRTPNTGDWDLKPGNHAVVQYDDETSRWVFVSTAVQH